MWGRKRSPALERFMRSMNIGYIEWHDGLGYDLDALAQLEGKDREEAEKVLVPRAEKDWRDLEALDRLRTPAAIAAILDARKSRNAEIRLHATGYGPAASEQEWEDAILYGFAKMRSYLDGLVYPFRAAANHPSMPVMDALWITLNGRRCDGTHLAAEALCKIAGLPENGELFYRLYGPDGPDKVMAKQELRVALEARTSLPHPGSSEGEPC